MTRKEFDAVKWGRGMKAKLRNANGIEITVTVRMVSFSDRTIKFVTRKTGSDIQRAYCNEIVELYPAGSTSLMRTFEKVLSGDVRLNRPYSKRNAEWLKSQGRVEIVPRDEVNP